jgi:hypothetical protein
MADFRLRIGDLEDLRQRGTGIREKGMNILSLRISAKICVLYLRQAGKASKQ